MNRSVQNPRLGSPLWLAALGVIVIAQPAHATMPADPALMAAEIAALTAPQLAGRGAGTQEERAAAELIARWFGEAGLQPAFAGDWRQDVPLPPDLGGRSVNVAGIAPGRGGLRDRWLVVGAHLDHLGRVDPTATGEPACGEYYPGAGDNAAGIAALLHVARHATASATQGGERCEESSLPARRSLLFCAFGAEEIGLLGSAHFAVEPPVPLAHVDAMINLDAVGRLGGGPLHAAGLESCVEFAAAVHAAAEGLPLAAPAGASFQSDHVSFLARGIPSLFLFTSAYPEMNSPADSLAAVDLPGLARVAGVTARLVEDLRARVGPFTFQAPPPLSPTPDGNRQTWFGSTPDFSGRGGYRIAALAADGPAAQAGLRAGDVLVSLGGTPVVDLAEFTAALRQHAPGDVVEVVVERGRRRLSFLVTLGERAQRLR